MVTLLERPARSLTARTTAQLTIIPSVVGLSVVGGLAVVLDPTYVVVGLVGLAVFVGMTLNIKAAVLVYVASEPFSGYLTSLSSSSVKAVGGIMFLAWLVRLGRGRRPVQLNHLVVSASIALLVIVFASFVVNANGGEGLTVVIRYGSFIGALLVLVDTMRSGLAVTAVLNAFVLSCTVAATVAFVGFFLQGGGRASGPMADANDFAFYLTCALPFAILLWRRPGRFRPFYALAAVMLVTTILTTFSRGAIVGLAVMFAIALMLGLVRVRMLIAGAASLVVVVVSVLILAPALVQKSFHEKNHVAADNVTSRYASWTIAAEMTADHPLLGVGPGRFALLFDRYAVGVPDATHLDVAHEMYLDVSSQLGLLGLAAFVTMLASGIAGAKRAMRSAATRAPATAVCLSFAGTLVAAAFLSEQYYLPIWLLAACGATLDPVRRTHA